MDSAKKTNEKYSLLRTICLGLILLLLMTNLPIISGTRIESAPVRGNRSIADHLLLSEVCVTPSTGEFIEIFNPTEGAISLDNYYLADIIDYYNLVNTTTGFNHTYATDFLAGFPSDSTIPPGGYQVIAMNSTDFIAEYGGKVPNYCLEGVESPLMNGTNGFIGGSVGLTDGGETVVLFYWDGTNDLVEDVDIVWWGSNDAYKIDKSSISIDSEHDGDATTSTYNNDASNYPSIKSGAHGSGNSFNRTDFSEPEEVQNAGNGKTGHDETSENLTASWIFNTEANPMTTVPPRSPPVIRSVVQNPEGNPTPGTDVTVTANVTDDGQVSSVNISVTVDDGVSELHPMSQGEGDNYSYTIAYNGPPMTAGTTVRYNVSATDDEGNVSYTANYSYVYENYTELILIITEVMFDDKDGGDDWIELYCIDDGNESGGNHITDWAVDDMDSDYDKVFGNVTVRTGDVVLIHYNDGVTPDETNALDRNIDGVIDLYTGASNTRLKVQGDQVILIDPEDNIKDAVCWTFNDTLSSGTEANDMNVLFGSGQWNSSENSSCVDSEDVEEGWSIARSKGEVDTNSKADWYAMESPSPGNFGNLSNLPPEIHNVILDPMPEDGTVLPMNNVTITARITHDNGILSANITWTLNGTPQENIPLMDDGNDPDVNAGDDNWTAVLPKQTEGSVVVISVEAYDTTLEHRISGSITITFSEPPEILKMLITEVMFDDKDTDDDWVELYCVDDGNSDNGNYITGWSVDDMDSDHDKVFGNVSVRTGDVVLLHYNDGVTPDENDSSGGNGDGVIDLYTGASNTRLKMEGDQVALYNHEGDIFDAVCWTYNNTLSSSTEADDMADLYDAGQWMSAENSSCVASDDVKEGWSISRIRVEPDTNSKNDWETLKTPTPGEGPALPVPFSFNFNVLMTGSAQAPIDGSFVINWSVGGDDNFVLQANISLYYYIDDLDGTGIFLTYLNPATEEYVWNLLGLDEGTYYVQVLIDDGIKAPYTINTSYALEIVELLPPEVEATVPANLATGIKTESDIKVIFNSKMDIDSFKIEDTFTISPAIHGTFKLEGEMTAVFDPEVSMSFNTAYDITLDGVMSAEGAEMVNSYEFSFTTEILHLYKITGTVVPKDAAVSIDGGSVDVTNGQFESLQPNGSYRIVISAEGFETHIDMFTIYGSDKDLGDIELDELPPEMYEVPRLGPFVYKGTTLPVEGVNLSLEINSVTYYADTDSDGYARFILPMEEIPEGTTITAKKDAETQSWKWEVENNPYDLFIKPDDGINGNGKDTDKGSETTLWTVLIVLVVLIIGVIIVIVIYLLRTKKKDIETGSTPIEPNVEQAVVMEEKTGGGTEIHVHEEAIPGESTDDIESPGDQVKEESVQEVVLEEKEGSGFPVEAAPETAGVGGNGENQAMIPASEKEGTELQTLENVFESTLNDEHTITDEELLDE